MIAVYLVVFLFAAVGVILGGFVEEAFIDEAPMSGALSGENFVYFLAGMIWLLISICAFYGGKKAAAETAPGSKKVKVAIGPTLVILWCFCVMGVVLGSIIYQIIHEGAVTVDGDTLLTSLLSNLAIALGPTYAAALAVTNKAVEK